MGDSINSFVTQSADSLPQCSDRLRRVFHQATSNVTCTETSKASDGNALSPTRYLAGHSVQFLSLDTMYLTAALPALPLASRCRSVASALAPLLPRQPQAAARLTAHATCKEV